MPKILPDTWPLPAELRDRVGTQLGRQRTVTHEGHTLLLLHQLPKDHVRKREPAVFWRTPDGSWRCYPGRDRSSALREHVDACAHALEHLDERVERADKAAEFLSIIKAARPLYRYARNLHAALREAVDALPDEHELRALRDRTYELERLGETVASDAENGMQYTIAQHSEEQAALSERIARESHRLNLLAAVALPITAIGSVLGMNLSNGLEWLPEPVSFWLLVAGMFAFGFYLRSRVQQN